MKLYVRRVFIMDEADKLMPHYLRFVKGVVDSDDLPLNVSREILQHDKKIDSIRSANVKRVLGLLEKLAKNDAEKYQTFWNEFGKVLKEGPAEDFANREKIAGLLRFAVDQVRRRRARPCRSTSTSSAWPRSRKRSTTSPPTRCRPRATARISRSSRKRTSRCCC